ATERAAPRRCPADTAAPRPSASRGHRTAGRACPPRPRPTPPARSRTAAPRHPSDPDRETESAPQAAPQAPGRAPPLPHPQPPPHPPLPTHPPPPPAKHPPPRIQPRKPDDNRVVRVPRFKECDSLPTLSGRALQPLNRVGAGMVRVG